eukprot:TRINITY_DN64066_c0_g1_i1.p1 TRINITY_DN64066_c0_g1~~TRINITY_DN64066_c0_g1_i1.p1  ORF type:complete len:587 (-),score=125.77 TRINITY_DN64066_c0_g1_i1:33-1793(-)
MNRDPNAPLKLHPLSLEKEAWENVPSLVFKAFQVLNTNMNSLKKWCDRSDERFKLMQEDVKKNQDKLDVIDESIRSLQDRATVIEAGSALFAEQQRELASVSADSLQRLDSSLACMFANIGKRFGVDIEETIKAGTETARLLYPEEDGKTRPESQEGSASGSPQRTASVISIHNNSNAPSLAAMKVAGQGLQGSVAGLDEAFQRWADWHTQKDTYVKKNAVSIEELRMTAQKAQEDFTAFHKDFQVSREFIDVVSKALEKTQNEVQDLTSTRVLHHDVDAAIAERAEDLEDLHKMTESRVEVLTNRVEAHVAEVERLIAESTRQSDEKIEDHTGKVSEFIERHMNPVNAYLNTMHVKADTMRVELDKLSEEMPKMSSRIDNVGENLKSAVEDQAAKAESFSIQLGELSTALGQYDQKSEEQNAHFSQSIEALAQDLENQIGGVRYDLQGTAQVLDSVRNEDLYRVARDLGTLEQKVAKWVHAHPLPAKISEARLFSLEARLAEEMDARLTFESKVRSKAGSLTPSIAGMLGTPRLEPSMGDPMGLPMLQPNTPQDPYAYGQPPGSSTARRPLKRHGGNVMAASPSS